MAQIRIKSNLEWSITARAIEIYIDGKKVGTLKYRETQEYEVENGEHEIFAKTNWRKSVTTLLKISENETKHLTLNGLKYGSFVKTASLALLLLYFLGKYMLDISLNFLLWIAAVGFLSLIYYKTIGKNSSLMLTKDAAPEINKKKITNFHSF